MSVSDTASGEGTASVLIAVDLLVRPPSFKSGDYEEDNSPFSFKSIRSDGLVSLLVIFEVIVVSIMTVLDALSSVV